MANRTERLIEAFEAAAAANGLELVDLEVAGTTKNPLLRVYLDGKEGGITLDQLAAAQEWVDATVERLDPFQNSYTLEVSSPGIDRPLRKREDFERFAGEDAVVYLKQGESRSKITGVLQGLDGDEVVIVNGDERECVLFDRIKKANIVGQLDFSAHDFEALDDIDSTTEDRKEQ